MNVICFTLILGRGAGRVKASTRPVVDKDAPAATDGHHGHVLGSRSPTGRGANRWDCREIWICPAIPSDVVTISVPFHLKRAP